MNRAAMKDVTNTQTQNSKQLEMNFVSTPPEETEFPYVSLPQNESEFFADSSVRSCSTTLLVRKYYTENSETVFLQRLNKNRKPTNFQFPASFIPKFLDWIEKLLKRVERKPNGQYKIKELTEITTDFSRETFWKSDEALKIGNLWVSPFLSKFGVQIRLWGQLENGEYREFVNEEGNEIKWFGPTNTISIPCLERLKNVLTFYQQEDQPDIS